MSSDLAEALVQRGHQVDVVLIDWNAPSGRPTRKLRTCGNVSVIDIAPKALSGLGKLAYRISKMLWSQAHAAGEMRRQTDLESYDALIAFTPASTLAGPIKLARRIPRRILFVFDFYPIYQKEIGIVPDGPIFRAAMRREERLFRSFDSIVCNLPSNAQYLRRNYHLNAEQRVLNTPLWSDISEVPKCPRDEVRTRNGLPVDRPIAIFGGQITDGRGIELMLDAAQHAAAASSDLYFLFVGEGRLTDLVDRHAATSGNLQRISGRDRDAYLQIASACDVGMVATVPGVTSFNFPTKTIDYLRVSLPVVAAVEPGSDYVDILTRWGVGAGAAFDDSIGFFAALETMVGDITMKAEMPGRALNCLTEVFDVMNAADLVLAEVTR